MIKRFISVAIAVKDLDVAVKKYSEVLGVKPNLLPAEHFAYPGLKGAWFRVGEARISLIAYEKADTPIAKFLETRGEGVNLLSFEVSDIEQDMKELAKKGVKFVSDKPLTIPDGKVNFTHPKSMHGVMFEFAQPKPEIDLLAG